MNDMKWLRRNVSVLKTVITMMVNTMREMASWMTFSWIRLNGPPLMIEPMRLAGIMKKYSIKAMPHDSKMMKMRGQSLDDGTTSGNLSCPYQAKVMKTLEAIRSRMV